ncbi:MAG: hypothetical protein QOH00_3490 [Gaiellales bacterium]|jgi:hypothetical protein|nr:hypothetical protein [Gaiellales bacterium]
MDPIRPIGPPERDLAPIVRVTRPDRDGGREPREQPDRQPRRQPPPPSPALPRSVDPDEPESLIDIKV